MEIEALVEFMKKERVLTVKMGGLQVELHPSAFAPDQATVENLSDLTGTSLPTDDELLFWSAPEEVWKDAEREA
jgi:hypothetical protein